MRIAVLALLLAACNCPQKAAGPSIDPTIPDKIDPRTRQAAVAKDDPLHDRVEGIAFANGCQADKDCHTGGCGAEICSADIDATSSCDVQEWPIKGASCGCLAGECIWFRTIDPAEGANRGDPCPDNKCKPGLTCMTYYGIAGPSGPKFTSCETPCAGGSPCEEGLTCTTIADGPGQVCRPAAAPESQPSSP